MQNRDEYPDVEAEVRFSAPAPRPAEVYGLMEALKASLAASEKEVEENLLT